MIVTPVPAIVAAIGNKLRGGRERDGAPVPVASEAPLSKENHSLEDLAQSLRIFSRLEATRIFSPKLPLPSPYTSDTLLGRLQDPSRKSRGFDELNRLALKDNQDAPSIEVSLPTEKSPDLIFNVTRDPLGSRVDANKVIFEFTSDFTRVSRLSWVTEVSQDPRKVGLPSVEISRGAYIYTDDKFTVELFETLAVDLSEKRDVWLEKAAELRRAVMQSGLLDDENRKLLQAFVDYAAKREMTHVYGIEPIRQDDNGHINTHLFVDSHLVEGDKGAFKEGLKDFDLDLTYDNSPGPGGSDIKRLSARTRTGGYSIWLYEAGVNVTGFLPSTYGCNYFPAEVDFDNFLRGNPVGAAFGEYRGKRVALLHQKPQVYKQPATFGEKVLFEEPPHPEPVASTRGES